MTQAGQGEQRMHGAEQVMLNPVQGPAQEAARGVIQSTVVRITFEQTGIPIGFRLIEQCG